MILLAEPLVRFANLLVRSRFRNYRDQMTGRSDRVICGSGGNRSDLAALCKSPRRTPAVIVTTRRGPEGKPPWPEARREGEGEGESGGGAFGCRLAENVPLIGDVEVAHSAQLPLPVRGAALDALRHPTYFILIFSPSGICTEKSEQKIPPKSLRSPLHGHSTRFGFRTLILWVRNPALPFILSKEDAVKKTWLWESPDGVGSLMAKQYPGPGTRPQQPSVKAMYVPLWFIDGEVTGKMIMSDDAEVRAMEIAQSGC